MTEDISDLVARLRRADDEDDGWFVDYTLVPSADVREAADALTRLSSELEAVKAERDRWEKHATTGDGALARTRAKLEAAEARNRELEAKLDEAIKVSKEALAIARNEGDFISGLKDALNKGAPDAQG